MSDVIDPTTCDHGPFYGDSRMVDCCRKCHAEVHLLPASSVDREKAIERVIAVLAPNGIPVFEWGHETTPTAEEVRALAEQIVAAVLEGAKT